MPTHESRRLRRAIGGLLLILPSVARAQERLLGERTLGVGPTAEWVRFGGAGLALTDAIAGDTLRVRRVTQVSFPVSAAMTLGGAWRLDVTSLLGSGTATFTDRAGRERTASLAGMSDVRARATGRLFSDAVLLTIGVNAPTGRTSLDGTQYGALRVLAAPALGLGSSPVGAGPSGVLGMVVARQAAAWTVAAGASYEHRGRFQPVAALVAGAPSIDFRPGGVMRASLSADRLIGRHRLHLATAADVFAADRLRDGRAPAGAIADLAAVRLGPVLATDAQVEWATPRLRELVTYASYRWRAPFARDGITVTGSDAQYLDGGVRATVPVRPSLDVVLGSDVRWHSGLGVESGLPGAGVTSALVLAGLRVRARRLSWQPFVRAQGGRLRLRDAGRTTASEAITGVTGGMIAVVRF